MPTILPIATIAQSDTQISLSVLGGFTLNGPANKHIYLPNRKACALLAYLALSPNRCETRERLAGLLWSERSEEQARASLRQCLRQIRSLLNELGFIGFQAERQEILLSSSDLSVDILTFIDGISRGFFATDVLTRDFLPERLLYGFEDLDPSYTAWLRVTRQHLRGQLVDRLQACLENSKSENTRRAAELLIVIDKTHEEAHRFLIRHYAETGNTAAALDQYAILWDVLDDEYDVEPAEETQALIIAIKSGVQVPFDVDPDDLQSEISNNRPPKQHATVPVVGIGAFSGFEGDASGKHIVDNFRREVVASMIRFREWQIVDHLPGDEIADYVIDGSAVKSNDQLVVILTMIERDKQRYVWSEKLEISKINWFEAQQTLISRISISINIYLSAERLRGQHAKHARYNQWVKGQNEMLYWNPMNEAKAEMTLRKTIQEAPEFAPAYGCLAAIYNTRHFKNPGTYRSKSFVDEAMKLARISVDLDPLDSRNQLALAWSCAMGGRFDQAEIYFNLAHELNPNSPTTLVPCAHGLSYCGQREKGREIAETAARINPSMPNFQWGYVGCIRFLDRDFEGAIAAFDIAGDIIPDFDAWKAAAYAMIGEKTRATLALNEFQTKIVKNWQGKAAATDQSIREWFLHCFPIRRTNDQKLLRKGLLKAGL